MWSLTLEGEYTKPKTGEPVMLTKTFLFKTAEERAEWLQDKQAMSDALDVITRRVDHENEVIYMTKEQFKSATTKWLEFMEALKQKWGAHMIPSNFEYTINSYQKGLNQPITKWPVVHVYESGKVRKLLVFEDHMSMTKWHRESTTLKNKLKEFNPGNLLQSDHDKAYRWVSEVVEFHKTWGHKMVPDLVTPLQKIEEALNIQKSGIEAGCWFSFEEEEGLEWYGSFEL